ncbi:MAG: DUF5615 family PIN-like protein [Candidatus Brockarchaeota archaeon]|nr:DUF5615 family PIN-like protein [Candidatus Brockarchaeota archaeon]
MGRLRQKSVDIISVAEVSPGLSDREILDLASKQGRIVITFDVDFGRLVFREKLKVNVVILLRIIPKSPRHITKKVENILASGIPMENCFLIVKEDDVRIIPM